MLYNMPKLSVVPTPIGNLKDITLRALEVLKEVDLIICEDTRVTLKLLQHLEIDPPKLLSYHVANEHKKINILTDQIQQHEWTALVSDAGTPGISDPGYTIIHACIENNIPVEVLPGPVAFIPALVGSGLPMQRFYFEGFLPHQKGRKKRLEFLSKLKGTTIVFYESPYRIIKLLKEIIEIWGENIKVSVSRELTKMHEETIRGTALETLVYFTTQGAVKGEFIVLIYNE
jgi:16S rRNA (cytidine1402-2'-O)-methyltransferase